MDSDSDLVIVKVTSPSTGSQLRQGTIDRYFSPSRAHRAAQDNTSFTHGAEVQEDTQRASERAQHLDRTGKRPESGPRPDQQPKEEEDAHGDQDVTSQDLEMFEENIASYNLDALANGAGGSSRYSRHLAAVYQAWQQRQQLLVHQSQRLLLQQRQDAALAASVSGGMELNNAVPGSAGGSLQDSQTTADVNHQQQQQSPDVLIVSDSEDGGQVEHSASAEEPGFTGPPQPKRRRTQHASPPPATMQQKVQQRPRQQRQPQSQQHLRPASEQAAAARHTRQPLQPAQAELQQAVQQPLTQLPPQGRQPTQQRQRRPPAAAATGAADATTAGAAGAGAVGSPLASGPEQQLRDENVKRRKLRQKLHRVEAAAYNEREALTSAEAVRSGELVSRLEDLKGLGELAHRPREAAQHAGVLAAFAGLARQALHSFTSHSAGRQPSDLLAAIKRCYRLRNPAAAAAAGSGAAGAVPIDWAALGRGACGRLFREAPGVACMLGPLQAQHKPRRRVQRYERRPPGQEVRPIDRTHAAADDPAATQETDIWVQAMRSVLQQVGRAPVVTLVVNTNPVVGFAQTVENVFALSFLTKDLFVRLEEDPEEGLVARHVTKEEKLKLVRQQQCGPAPSGAGSLHSQQFVMQLDMETWREMCKVVPGGRGLMPHRPRHAG